MEEGLVTAAGQTIQRWFEDGKGSGKGGEVGRGKGNGIQVYALP